VNSSQTKPSQPGYSYFDGEKNELPRRKQRGINKENIFNIAASGGEYNPERFKENRHVKRTDTEVFGTEYK
jgi:hypothetical protein